jgi:hypothetical protein
MRLEPISEPWTRTITCIGGVVATFALILGGGFSLYQYFQNRAYQLQTQRFEAVRPFFEERLKMYLEITNLTGTIATSKNDADVGKAKERFLEILYGPANLVVDGDVSVAMSHFRQCMDDSKCTNLPILSSNLSNLCSNSVKSGFLPPDSATNVRVVAK